LKQIGDNIMNKRKHVSWILFGTIAAFLIGWFSILLTQMITWIPPLVEIASVTWNNNPLC